MPLSLMVTKRIGRKQFHFTVSGNNLHETVAEYDRLSFSDVASCACCHSDNLTLASRVAQGKFKYTSVKCLDCKADITFGKREDDDLTYFLRRRENGELDWKAFDKEAKS